MRMNNFHSLSLVVIVWHATSKKCLFPFHHVFDTRVSRCADKRCKAHSFIALTKYKCRITEDTIKATSEARKAVSNRTQRGRDRPFRSALQVRLRTKQPMLQRTVAVTPCTKRRPSSFTTGYPVKAAPTWRWLRSTIIAWVHSSIWVTTGPRTWRKRR